MRKGDLSLNYIFLLFVGVISLFVIVAFLTKSAINADNIMCKIGLCKKEIQFGGQIVLVTNEDVFRNEIIKQSKICFEVARKAEIGGELCYGIKCQGCITSCDSDLVNKIEKQIGRGNVDCNTFTPSEKAIIGYDYKINKVIII